MSICVLIFFVNILPVIILLTSLETLEDNKILFLDNRYLIMSHLSCENLFHNRAKLNMFKLN